MSMRVTERGFTVVELIVAMVFLSLFVGLLFQMYLTGITQRKDVTYRAAASDLAMTNLRKITSKSSPLLTATCGPSNDLTATPAGTGTALTFTAESLTGTTLPSSTTQTMIELFPRGCDPSMPVEVISTVTFGSESVSRATYVN